MRMYSVRNSKTREIITPSKAAQKRPTLVEDRNGDKRHYQSEADAIFESLEAELRVTRRALELMCNDFNILEIHASQRLPSTVQEYIEVARKEIGQ
jgi:hypothetical protein